MNEKHRKNRAIRVLLSILATGSFFWLTAHWEQQNEQRKQNEALPAVAIHLVGVVEKVIPGPNHHGFGIIRLRVL